MYRHDPYPYGPTSEDVFIDGDYIDWKTLNEHRVQNVGRLSIAVDELRKVKLFPRLKSVSYFGYDAEYTGDFSLVPSMPLMENITFVKLYGFDMVDAIKDKAMISRLRSLSFIDHCSSDLTHDYDPDNDDERPYFEQYTKMLDILLVYYPHNRTVCKY